MKFTDGGETAPVKERHHHSAHHSGHHISHHHHRHHACEEPAQRAHNPEKHSYPRRMILKKIPLRFVEIAVPEIAVSLCIGLVLTLGSAAGTALDLPIVAVGVLGCWIALWESSRVDRLSTHRLKNYYICNISAFLLFLAVAVMTFIVGKTAAHPLNGAYYLLFRLSYVTALAGDAYDLNSLSLSFAVFYGVSFLILIGEPPVSALLKKLADPRGKHDKKPSRNKIR